MKDVCFSSFFSYGDILLHRKLRSYAIKTLREDNMCG